MTSSVHTLWVLIHFPLCRIFISWGCFKRWQQKCMEEWQTYLKSHYEAAAQFVFPVKGSESIAQSMAELLTAGGRKAAWQEKLQSVLFDPRGVGITHTFPSLTKWWWFFPRSIPIYATKQRPLLACRVEHPSNTDHAIFDLTFIYLFITQCSLPLNVSITSILFLKFTIRILR